MLNSRYVPLWFVRSVLVRCCYEFGNGLENATGRFSSEFMRPFWLKGGVLWVEEPIIHTGRPGPSF